jgi:hypothetical protein
MGLAAGVDVKRTSVKDMTNPRRLGSSGRCTLSLHGPTRILLLKLCNIGDETKGGILQ